uniref:Chromo domain-containing protein n=1 Tax=Ananas comosus var. bracteatus TaxID=296719 RepID=A0A6V7Q8Y2_ANACO|nr:unnamed protein product [Ananas comosus var. bracteatus]
MCSRSTYADVLQEAEDKVHIAQECLLTAQSRQRSYADRRRRDLEFQIGDHVFLKVSPTKEIRRFEIRGEEASESRYSACEGFWSNHDEREATWELESALQERYPHLFQMEVELFHIFWRVVDSVPTYGSHPENRGLKSSALSLYRNRVLYRYNIGSVPVPSEFSCEPEARVCCLADFVPVHFPVYRYTVQSADCLFWEGVFAIVASLQISPRPLVFPELGNSGEEASLQISPRPPGVPELGNSGEEEPSTPVEARDRGKGIA